MRETAKARWQEGAGFEGGVGLGQGIQTKWDQYQVVVKNICSQSCSLDMNPALPLPNCLTSGMSVNFPFPVSSVIK